MKRANPSLWARAEELLVHAHDNRWIQAPNWKDELQNVSLKLRALGRKNGPGWILVTARLDQLAEIAPKPNLMVAPLPAAKVLIQ